MSKNQLTKEQISWYNKKSIIIEATTTSSGSGSYKVPIRLGTKIWEKDELSPFTIQVSKYNDSQLAYDNYDGKLDVQKKTVKKMERIANKQSIKDKKRKENQDDDGLGSGRSGGNGGSDNGGLSEIELNKKLNILYEELATIFSKKRLI